MILKLAHLVKPFFSGDDARFPINGGFFPSAYETTFNDGSLSQFFFLLVRLISNYSDPNRHIFALHELTVCWNCFWWSTVSPIFPLFCKMKQKLSALVDKSNIWESTHHLILAGTRKTNVSTLNTIEVLDFESTIFQWFPKYLFDWSAEFWKSLFNNSLNIYLIDQLYSILESISW